MPPVFAHGRLRLYLLKLLDEAPRHGYEVIRLLEERFQGLYAPSAGTVYPRLAKLEAEGLVQHVTEGGRKVYSLTAQGKSELLDRQDELADLELEIRESLSTLAEEIRADVRGSASELRREVREATRLSGGPADDTDTESSPGGPTTGATGAASGEGSRTPRGGDTEAAWQRAKAEMREAKREWQRQARRARDESRRAREQAKAAEAAANRAHHMAQKQAQQEAQEAAQEELRRIARNVQDQVHERAKSGDWQGAVRDGMAELAKEMGTLGRVTGQASTWQPFGKTRSGAADRSETPVEPEWAAEPTSPGADPARELERLLDRFRDDVRDAARDRGVTEDQLREIRRELSAAAAHIGVTLRPTD